MVADVSAVTYFAPIFAFFIVFLVVFAVLFKSELLGKSRWVMLFLSFVIASLFISAGSVRLYVETIVPWFGALMVSLFFMMMLIGLSGSMSGIKPDKMHWLGWTFIVVALGMFLISGLVVFSDSLGPYLPGSYSYVGTPFTDWLYSPAVFGGILLLALSAIVSWVLVKK